MAIPAQLESLYHVHLGTMGELQRCRWRDGGRLARGARVVCRTIRGVELGRIAAPARSDSLGTDERQLAGKILRVATAEDRLLDRRLEKHKRQAVRDCQREIADQRLEPILLDVDHLFDGRTLIFHFLGPVDGQVQQLVDRLADVYEQRSQMLQFSKLLSEGCGPGCGSGDAGCGSEGGCAVCVVAQACGQQAGS